ncbi:hypothetical protein SEA_BANTAM_147 [Gordonia phage Bantam]|uniref:Uncharacterized protein n=1 Tax=Gordonia phage Bantam TaxID=1887641 RepID=A0A1B3AYI9_9CAUD|nr:hypothetical protein BIZ77_gp032 [Gordonia phage Bantam]AOE43836.1 hypothetical protein SEA_BANTAM_147 [Gordonia phage Bantam]
MTHIDELANWNPAETLAIFADEILELRDHTELIRERHDRRADTTAVIEELIEMLLNRGNFETLFDELALAGHVAAHRKKNTYRSPMCAELGCKEN